MFLCESMQKYLKGNTFIVSPVVAQKKEDFLYTTSGQAEGFKYLRWQTAKVKVAHWKKRLCIMFTLPIAEILSGKNVRAWVSMVLYLKKLMKIKILKRKKNPGSRLEVAC